MKKLTLFLAAFFTAFATIAQPTGTVLESKTLQSGILGREVKYSVYLPANYSSSERTYPVLYLLHGSGGNETNWVQVGEVQQIADRLTATGEATPMIIVMPDGQESWYLNDYKGENRYEDMFMQELLPYIETAYRVRPGKNFRAIAGLSMGGYGSLLYAMHHPDSFSTCVAMSAAVFTDEEIAANKRFALISKFSGDDVANGIVNEHWKRNSILHLASEMPNDQKKKVKFYIDCGDDDFLYKGNASLHILMRDRDIQHEYRVRDGGHSWDYWRSGLADALHYVTRSFRFQR